MHNPTYKHLDAKLRLGGLRLGQWLQLVLAAGFALVFGLYVSPLPAGPTIALSVFVAGLPVAVSFAAMGLEFSVSGFVRAAWRWTRSPRRYLPGPGLVATGYVVGRAERASDEHSPVVSASKVAELWD
jgi:uncharacterized membrane protein